MIFEDPIVSFLPNDPIDEAWKDVPESIKKRTLERVPRPTSNGVYYVSLFST